MKVIQPLTITEDNLIESNLYDVAPALYNAGTTYALGAYVGVAGTLGEILIYKSLQASNTANTPASSPTSTASDPPHSPDTPASRSAS